MRRGLKVLIYYITINMSYDVNKVCKIIDEIIKQPGEDVTDGECIDQIQEFIDEVSKTPQEPFDLFGIETDYGWYGLIIPIIKTIEKENLNRSAEDQIVITQIKEKFGTLRFYVNNAPDYIRDRIRVAEKESLNICEHCGSATNVSQQSVKGWISTLCDTCRSK